MHSILLLPLVARCLETIYVYIWCMFVFMSVVVTVGGGGVCGNVCCVAGIVKYSLFCLGALKYVVCLCKGCDRCCVFCLYCDTWSCRCSCMGSMSVFRHAYVVCLCLVCILWQFSMLHSA